MYSGLLLKYVTSFGVREVLDVVYVDAGGAGQARGEGESWRHR